MHEVTTNGGLISGEHRHIRGLAIAAIAPHMGLGHIGHPDA
jgi:hypothetical protein